MLAVDSFPAAQEQLPHGTACRGSLHQPPVLQRLPEADYPDLFLLQ